MLKKALLASIICASILQATNKEIIVGKTYNFAERDMIELMQEFVIKNKTELEEKLAKSRDKTKDNIKKYKPDGLVALHPATQDRVFYPDLTYTLDRDITDASGKVMYKKGFKFNPADYVSLSYAMVVIDGTNKKQVEWFEKSGYANQLAYRLLLSDGSYYDLNLKLKQEVFYLMPDIRKKFQIQKTPSIIKQVGNRIEVKEVCVPCINENNSSKENAKKDSK